MKNIIIKTTFNNKIDAKKLARILLQKKLSACVQITKIESLYNWKGKIREDKEFLVSIKSKKRDFKKIQREIKENHSYDLPQILAIDISKSSNEYKNFIKENTI